MIALYQSQLCFLRAIQGWTPRPLQLTFILVAFLDYAQTAIRGELFFKPLLHSLYAALHHSGMELLRISGVSGFIGL